MAQTSLTLATGQPGEAFGIQPGEDADRANRAKALTGQNRARTPTGRTGRGRRPGEPGKGPNRAEPGEDANRAPESNRALSFEPGQS